MNIPSSCQSEIAANGFSIIENVFSNSEIDSLLEAISLADSAKPTFRKTSDLFAIRQFLKEVPAAADLIFTDKFLSVIDMLFGGGYFVVKSIYFDKPADSNWFVAYHQDLTISVDKKLETPFFTGWTVKQNQFAVQPPLVVLEKNFTIRIHLDDTDKNNGALKVVPGSHKKGVCRPETIDWTTETETICPVHAGGIMIMRPLLLHASSRTTNHKKRRVIHIEFSNTELPGGLNWAERG